MTTSYRKLWLIVLCVFVVIYFFRLRSIEPIEIPPGDRPVRIRLTIAQQPYLKGSYQIIDTGLVLIKTGRFPSYFYGSKIEVFGKFEKEVINRSQLRYVSYFPTIRLVESSGKAPDFQQLLLKLRSRLEGVINSLLPEPHASLLAGIIFGVKAQMPQKFLQNLRGTGTIHIVVASGQNLTIVASFLLGLCLSVMSRRMGLLVAGLGVLAYILMVGAEPPVVRAGIMAVVGYFAQAIGREQEGVTALIFAALVMLIISPLILFDIGFQLSFGATAGIIWLRPRLMKLFGKMNLSQKNVLSESFSTTLAAQAGIMPIILKNFGSMSLMGPLVNGLILWLVPIIMCLGSILAFLGMIIRPIAGVLSWPVWLLLEIFIRVVNFFGQIPWASFKTGQISNWWAIGYYSALILLMIIISQKDERN